MGVTCKNVIGRVSRTPQEVCQVISLSHGFNCRFICWEFSNLILLVKIMLLSSRPINLIAIFGRFHWFFKVPSNPTYLELTYLYLRFKLFFSEWSYHPSNSHHLPYRKLNIISTVFSSLQLPFNSHYLYLSAGSHLLFGLL